MEHLIFSNELTASQINDQVFLYVIEPREREYRKDTFWSIFLKRSIFVKHGIFTKY